jgi:hypothetical protein
MVYQLLQSGKYRRRLHLFNLKGIIQFRQVAAWIENLLFRAVVKRPLYNDIHDVKLRLFNDCNNLDKPALTQRIIYINSVCDRIEKMYIGIFRLVGAGWSDYWFPT